MEIYLDNSATTKPYKEVIDKMVYALDTDYANPSSLHRKGVEVEKNIKNIRQSIAKTLGAKDKEIYFTSGGTESNNTIIRGIVALNKKRKNHIISTTIEHPSVLNTLKDLESEGCEVTYLEVDKNGKIDIEEFKNALKPTTCLVTIMHVNNEIGSIQPIQEISKHLKTLKDKVYLHVDAVQSYAKINFRPSRYNIDFMSVSSYGNGTESSGTVRILKDLDVDIAGKNVLIVEDIIDSGLTLSNLVKELEIRNPKSLKLCTLLDKPERRTSNIPVDYVGFVIEDKFIVGYGIDWAEKYRNLPYIGSVTV